MLNGIIPHAFAFIEILISSYGLECPFISTYGTPFSISCKASTIGYKLFCLSWNVLLFHHRFWQTDSLNKRFLDESISFAISNISAHCLLASKASTEKSAKSLTWVSLVCDKSLLSCCFQMLCLWLLTVWLECVLVWISLNSSYWSLLSFLDIYIHVFHQIWEVSGYYF